MQHVQVPHELVELRKSGKLEQGDQVIYASVKKFMNSDTRECFPSITKISNQLDCSRQKIVDALERLSKANLIKITREGRRNKYTFLRRDWDNYFEMFTNDFLQLDMPINVKEYYMGVQPYLYGKETGVGRCSFANTELAERLGLHPISVKKYNTWLIEHGYMEEELTDKTDEAGLTVVQKNFNLTGLQQAALWVKTVSETLETHDEKIESLEKKVALLEKELAKTRNSNLYKAIPEEFEMK